MPIKKRAQPSKKIVAIGLTILLLLISAVMICWLLMRPLSAQASDYAIHGFDVSHHQHDIEWSKIPKDKYRFVYLKATEGGDFKDRKFQENWKKAREQGFLVGAYHFYRLCRDAQVQAQNFINSVPQYTDSLPPVIDLEYDSQCIDTYSKQQLLAEITIMHNLLQQHYAKQPIFYVSKNFYNIVLAGNFKEVPLWVREYQGLPNLKDQPDWLFWQHSNKGKIQGISTPVDLNVFYGSNHDWERFLQKNAIKPANSAQK